MGAYIKGMKMSKNCLECEIKAWEEGFSEYVCPFSGIPCLSIGRQDDCPLVELPEKHGDLIDRDALVKEMTNGIRAGNLEEGYEMYPNINNMDDCIDCVRYTDAVIEAEGE